MNRQELENYLKLLGQKLIAKGITGEIILAGGAVMLLVVRNRETTKDIDAYFGDHPEIRMAALEIACEEGLREDWLNDGVKGFFYGNPPQVLWAEYPGLRVYTVHPEYLFAMKVLPEAHTECPGKYFPAEGLRKRLGERLKLVN